jgi:hypothetical protein
MNVKFESKFAKDLRKLKDQKLLSNIKTAINECKLAPELSTLSNLTSPTKLLSLNNLTNVTNLTGFTQEPYVLLV